MSDTVVLGTAQTLAPSIQRPRRSLHNEIFRARWAYLFIAPFFIFFALFMLYPVLFSLYLSLTEWKGLGPIKFVGLENYQRLLGDTVFWQSMLNGALLFVMYVPAMTVLALVLAVLLNSRRVRGFRIFRTILFMPYITVWLPQALPFGFC
jgi:ABC-type sugar transport system permease subunit